MFRSLLSGTAARVWEVKSQAAAEGSVATLEEDTTISLDVDALYALLPQVGWRAVAGSLEPVYRAVQHTLGEEVENVVRVLAELEESSSAPERTDSRNAADCKPESLSARDDAALVATVASPSIPTIVITPCETQLRESSCWVPFQDACFGNRLVVPAHPVVNDVYPPLLARPLPLARKWEYANGHWRAVLPSVDEQVQRGLFSRVLSVRRRARLWRAASAI